MESGIVDWLNYILKDRLCDELKLTYNNKQRSFLIEFDSSDFKISVNEEKELYQLKRYSLNIFCDDIAIDDFLFENLAFISTNVNLQGRSMVRGSSQEIFFSYDFLGLLFWILNRVEEYSFTNTNDLHERFTAKDSILYASNLHLRPVVDEWFHFLRLIIERMCPEIELKKVVFRFRMTHDIDRPFRYVSSNFMTFFKRINYDFIRGKIDFFIYLKLIFYKIRLSPKLRELDPYDTFNELLFLTSEIKDSNMFFLMSGKSHEPTDPEYSLYDVEIYNLIKYLCVHGCEIGFHPSYNTFNNVEIFRDELNVYKDFLKRLDYSGPVVVRMHYLRMAFPSTMSIMEKLGVQVDETMGFADTIGFRCGTSFEYKPYNLIERRVFNITVRPLQAMQWSINSPSYMNLDIKSGFEKLYSLAKMIANYGGTMSYLVHNDEYFELGDEFKEEMANFMNLIRSLQCRN